MLSFQQQQELAKIYEIYFRVFWMYGLRQVVFSPSTDDEKA